MKCEICKRRKARVIIVDVKAKKHIEHIAKRVCLKCPMPKWNCQVIEKL